MILFVLLLTVAGALFVGFLVYRHRQEEKTVLFSYSENDAELVNPARGFYTQIDYKEPERLKVIREEGHTLSLVTMNLKDHIEEPVPQEDLMRLRALFEEAGRQQVMLLFRAAYRWDEDCGEPELSVMKTHIEQISEVINEYKDVVLAVQTGMIGQWGEWHGSAYLEDEEAMRNDAMKVVKWWLENLDPSIGLNLRRPVFIQTAMEEGLDADRLGMHNDALLATDSDMGTYADRTGELAWCEEHLNAKVNGGEMPYVSEYSEPENAVREFDQLALMYLNAYYNVEVLEDWKSKTIDGENAYDYIGRHLGYRYSLKTLETTEKIYAASKKIQLKLQLKNSGFSTIQNRFRLYLVVDDGEEKRFLPLERTNRAKELETYECTVELTEKMKKGSCFIGLCYTDAVDDRGKCPGQDAHTVQFANDEMRFEDGINYFISYHYEKEGEPELIPDKIR